MMDRADQVVRDDGGTGEVWSVSVAWRENSLDMRGDGVLLDVNLIGAMTLDDGSG